MQPLWVWRHRCMYLWVSLCHDVMSLSLPVPLCFPRLLLLRLFVVLIPSTHCTCLQLYVGIFSPIVSTAWAIFDIIRAPVYSTQYC